VERAKFTVDRVHFRTRPTLLPGYYAIVGNAGPMTLKGYRYIGQVGQNWEECPEIVAGLTKSMYWPCPDVFWLNGTWRLLVGYSKSGWSAYTWAWNKWIEDSSLLQGIHCPQDPEHPERTMECYWPGPRVFWFQGTLYLIFFSEWAYLEGDSCIGFERYHGFKWNGNQWKECPEIVEGLPSYHFEGCSYECNDVFDLMLWDGTPRLIRKLRHTCGGDIVKMFRWDFEQEKWLRDTEHEPGLWDHGGGNTGIQMGFGLFELEGTIYVVDGSYLSDAKEWVDDHWESSAMWTGLEQDKSSPWPTIFRVR